MAITANHGDHHHDPMSQDNVQSSPSVMVTAFALPLVVMTLESLRMPSGGVRVGAVVTTPGTVVTLSLHWAAKSFLYRNDL